MIRYLVPDISIPSNPKTPGYYYVGWLVVLRMYVTLAVFQPYRDLKVGDNQSPKIQVARPIILLKWQQKNAYTFPFYLQQPYNVDLGIMWSSRHGFQTWCNRQGGMLVEIHSQDENDFVQSLLPCCSGRYIQLHVLLLLPVGKNIYNSNDFASWWRTRHIIQWSRRSFYLRYIIEYSIHRVCSMNFDLLESQKCLVFLNNSVGYRLNTYQKVPYMRKQRYKNALKISLEVWIRLLVIRGAFGK